MALKKNRLRILAGVLVIVIAIFLYNKYRVAKRIDIEALSLTDLNGQQVKLAEFKDKKLFLNFFATWCGPCLQEMESLERAQALLANDNIQFLLISDEPISRLQSFQAESGLSLVILHSERSLKEEKIYTLPTSYLLNLKRRIIFDKVGVAEWHEPEMIKHLKSLAE